MIRIIDVRKHSPSIELLISIFYRITSDVSAAYRQFNIVVVDRNVDRQIWIFSILSALGERPAISYRIFSVLLSSVLL